MLSPETYSLINYREAETVVAEYNELVQKAQKVGNALSAEYKDAFYQLVLHQPTACANLNDLYVTVGKNHLYAKQGRAATNNLALKARALFKEDSLITHYYNTVLSDGKWNHMMDQTHIGYTSWQQPPRNIMPEVKEILVSERAEMGVAIEGSDKFWPSEKSDAVLPEFDCYNKQKYSIEIFNRGNVPFVYSVQVSEPWITIDKQTGRIDKEQRLFVSVDWGKAPVGKNKILITIKGNENSVTVFAVVNNPLSPKPDDIYGFSESNSYVSMEASDYSKAVTTSSVEWVTIPNLGRTGSAVTSLPVTAQVQTPAGDGPRLEYRVHFFSTGEVHVKVYISPVLNFLSGRGLCFAISFDEDSPQIINIHENNAVPDWRYPYWWNQAVSENIMIKSSTYSIQTPGEHILKFWMVDPGVVLQKIVIETGEVKPSYLGPPESYLHRH